MQMLSAACSATGPSKAATMWNIRSSGQKGTVRKIYWNQLIKSMSTTTTVVVVDYANNNHNSSSGAGQEEVEEEEMGQECPLGAAL